VDEGKTVSDAIRAQADAQRDAAALNFQSALTKAQALKLQKRIHMALDGQWEQLGADLARDAAERAGKAIWERFSQWLSGSPDGKAAVAKTGAAASTKPASSGGVPASGAAALKSDVGAAAVKALLAGIGRIKEGDWQGAAVEAAAAAVTHLGRDRRNDKVGKALANQLLDLTGTTDSLNTKRAALHAQKRALLEREFADKLAAAGWFNMYENPDQFKALADKFTREHAGHPWAFDAYEVFGPQVRREGQAELDRRIAAEEAAEKARRDAQIRFYEDVDRSTRGRPPSEEETLRHLGRASAAYRSVQHVVRPQLDPASMMAGAAPRPVDFRDAARGASRRRRRLF
jgi:hypothetical protein